MGLVNIFVMRKIFVIGMWMVGWVTGLCSVVLTGSYAPADSVGVRSYRFNSSDATVEALSGLSGISNPSYLAVSQDGSRVYSVGENDGKSFVHAIALDTISGRMSVMNSLPAGGGAPCHIALSPDGRFVVCANYNGGNIGIFALAPDGSLASGPEVVDFTGHSVDSLRQTQPRLHCITFTPDGRYLVADDLGLDKLHMFPVVEGENRLVDTSKGFDVDIRPGSGPRHLVYHPDGRHAYLINEISGYVTLLDYDGRRLTPRQYALADTLQAEGAGDIAVTPDGRHVYASLRLKGDGIAVFTVNPADGTLTRTGYTPTGRHPRNIALTPDGRYLLVASRDDNRIDAFLINPADGSLTFSHEVAASPRPVCIKFTR